MNYYTITEFARMTRSSRRALLHYDTVGLLPAALRGEKNYRMYSHTQLASMNLIHTCQAMGMTLEEIKYLSDNRTPELINELLDRYIGSLGQKLKILSSTYRLAQTLKKATSSALSANTEAISIQYFPAERIVLGKHNDYCDGADNYAALFRFYRDCSEKYPDLDLNYAAWGMFSEERVRRHDYVWPDRYYFFNPKGNDKRPAAFYAIGYQRGGYGQACGLYERILKYVDKNGFEICGPAFEEYPLNEICVKNEDEYLIRVMITVREK